MLPLLYPGTTAVVIGAGGLGHIGIQCLAALTATNIVVVDRNPDALDARRAARRERDRGRRRRRTSTASRTSPAARGADVVLDFVAEQGAENEGFAMTAAGGSYSVIGYGGELQVPTLDIISTERNVIGNIVGTYNELAELMVLAADRQGHPAHQDLPAGRRRRRARRSRRGQGTRPSHPRP